MDRTWATFKMYLRAIAIAIAIVIVIAMAIAIVIAIAIGIAMIFVEIQKKFEQLFVTLPGKFKSA